MSLTPEQASVIENPFESKLVCALPGSGKTHTTISLAERIIQHPNTRLFMGTFTNAAASEMQERIIKRLGENATSRIHAKTLAKAMLEQHKPLAQGRRLILGAELRTYVYRVFAKLNIHFSNVPYFEEQFDAFGRDLDWQPVPGNVLSAAYLELQNMLAIYQRVDLNTVAREVVYGLEQGTIKPLPYTHYLLDEFQDTDIIQYRWLRAHQGQGRYFTVVGDDDQSIYSWRGAVGFENMVQFRHDFQARPFLLSTCFRCAPYILGRAQTLIEHNQERIQKDMQSAKSELGKVSASVFNSQYISPFTTELSMRDNLDLTHVRKAESRIKNIEEYRFVVDQLAANFDQWTVLARTNLILDNLELCLSERGIPAIRLGGKSIYDNPHVIAVIKLLYGLSDKTHFQELVEGLGWAGECEETLQRMLGAGRRHGLGGVGILAKESITERLRNIPDEFIALGGTNEGCQKVIPKFSSILVQWFDELAVNDFKPRNSAIELVQKIMFSFDGPLLNRIKRLYDLAFKSRTKNKVDRAGKIVLCTLTGSKGLEWPKVFIMNCNEGVLPSMQDGETPDMCPQKVEEERRLLYVGMTRAEDELVIHYHKSKPSMFINELGTLLPFEWLQEPDAA